MNPGRAEQRPETSSHGLEKERQDDKFDNVEKKATHKGSDGLSLWGDAWDPGFTCPGLDSGELQRIKGKG
jgi:hypothetical protein